MADHASQMFALVLRRPTWQSMRSVMPPWPGMLSPKSLILNPRLKPLAKNPPNGAISDANADSTSAWNCTAKRSTEVRVCLIALRFWLVGKNRASMTGPCDSM